MQIDRLHYPIESLGPGKRLVIWTIGCSKNCNNCANQELWEKNDAKDIDVDVLFETITSSTENVDVDGITITGGDPFEQPEDLIALVKQLKTIYDDILVYTGYTESELSDILTSEEMEEIKKYVGVLIDGRYIDAKNDNTAPLRGSTNQNIIFYNENLESKYYAYMKEGRKIQNIYDKGRIISAGIHNKDTGDMK